MPETISIAGSRLNCALYPYLAGELVAAITAREVLAALRRTEARGRYETAHRVRALTGRVRRKAWSGNPRRAGRRQEHEQSEAKESTPHRIV